jgi:anaerobic selenocysteine-containing dehydrogenase
VVRITSPAGSIEALAYPHPGISPTVVSVPTGQGHISKDRYSEKRGANIFSILSSELVDEQTGALAWAATRVNIEKTGEWERLPKFENVAPDLATDDDHHIIQLTSEDH